MPECSTSSEPKASETTPRARASKLYVLAPIAAGVLGLGALALWLTSGTGKPLVLRTPGTDQAPGSEFGPQGNAVLAGKLVRSTGTPGNSSESWPQFRGADHDGISKSVRAWHVCGRAA